MAKKKVSKFKTVEAIKAHYAELLAPIQKERQDALKAFRAACKHPKRYREVNYESSKSEIFYDGYQPPGAPDYSYYSRKVTRCKACGRQVEATAWKHQRDR